MNRTLANGFIIAVLISGCMTGPAGEEDDREPHVRAPAVRDHFAYKYAWNQSLSDSTYLAVEIALSARSEYDAVFLEQGIWRNAFTYWATSAVLEWSSPHAVARSLGGTESATECPADHVGPIDGCPQTTHRTGPGSRYYGTLAPGRYVLYVAQFGADSAQLGIRFGANAPIETLRLTEGRTMLLRFQPDPEEGGLSASARIDGPFWVNFRSRGGSAQRFASLESGDNFLALTPTAGFEHFSEMGRWQMDEDRRPYLLPQHAAPAGDWTFRSVVEDQDTSEEYTIAGVMLDPGFVRENGTMVALGPGVTHEDDWPEGWPLKAGPASRPDSMTHTPSPGPG